MPLSDQIQEATKRHGDALARYLAALDAGKAITLREVLELRRARDAAEDELAALQSQHTRTTAHDAKS